MLNDISNRSIVHMAI